MDRSAWLLIASSLVSMSACRTESPTSPPAVPVQLQSRAIAIDVDLTSGVAAVRSPGVQTVAANRPSFALVTPGQPSYALLGRNEVSATTSNFTRSRIGEFTPQRVRVRFDLTLVNALLNADLVPSTFPVPPIAEIVAFPFATEPAGIFGLRVKASSDWDGNGTAGSGSIYNFFNDQVCIDLTPPPNGSSR